MPYSTEVEIEIVEPMGSDTLAYSTLAGQTLTFRAESDIDLKSGQKVLIGFDPARGSIFEAASGNRL
jgi:multiple sugar transport system ATP-binding protein